MNKQDLKERTKKFAVSTIGFVNELPKTKANDVISYQIIKSSTSVAANYRSSLRGRSSAEFISKLNVVLEEADETMFWLEMLEEINTELSKERLKALHKESNELTAIFSASLITARKNQKLKSKI